MPLPQSGILPEASPHAVFLTADLSRDPDAAGRARAACALIPTLSDELAATDPAAGLVSVLGVGPGAWAELVGAERPAQLQTFRARAEGLRKAPATPTDLLLHIRSARRDLNYELAQRCVAVAAFRYLDARDLTGFVDGTENPEGEERAAVALVGDEDPSFIGGSYVLLQRYVHDLSRWATLPKADQEGVIGRTKDTDEELDDGLKPPTAHISRVVIEQDGEELEILRHSLPYGDSREAGLVFVAYSRQRSIFDLMLDRMFHADADGHYDHLMDYTRAVSGAYYFAPSQELLAGLGRLT